MSDAVTVLAVGLAVACGWFLLLWLISIRVGDVTYVDAGWASGFVLVAAATYAVADGDVARRRALLAVTAIWGTRLAVHLLTRWRREGPDRRYVRMMARATAGGQNKHLVTLRKVFAFQAPLLWLVSLPVQLGQLDTTPTGITPVGYAGLALCVVGILFESIGDYQLVRFKADPRNVGRVLDTGLWRYTRHPNYFGDTCVWWGLWLVALTGLAGAVAVIGPLVLTYLLLRWSGVTIVERHLHRSRPGYEEYVRRTSSFIPMPPKPAGEPGAVTP